MATITCVTTPHKGLDLAVNYVWHLKERMSSNACPFKHSSMASAVADQTASSKLPIFGVVGVRPSAARRCPSGKGRSRHHQMTAGTPARRAPMGADARPHYEGRSRPPVTPQYAYNIEHVAGSGNLLSDMLARWAVTHPGARMSAPMTYPICPSNDPEFIWLRTEEITRVQEHAIMPPHWMANLMLESIA
jgi:hypothetical protein